jgi:hypothetical protein
MDTPRAHIRATSEETLVSSRRAFRDPGCSAEMTRLTHWLSNLEFGLCRSRLVGGIEEAVR